MDGEGHMKFTWSYELVAPHTIITLITALQKSAKKKGHKFVVQIDEFRVKFAKLHGFIKDASSRHFNEPLRLLRKSGIIWIEKGKGTTKLVSARSGTIFEIDSDILNVDITNEQEVFNYLAKKTYDFHIPFKLLVDTMDEHPNAIHSEVLRERLSEKMLTYAKIHRPKYFLNKKIDIKKRGRPWKYSLAHFNSFLAIIKEAGWINIKDGMIERISHKEEVKVTYEEFKNTIRQEYNKIINKNANILMISIDILEGVVCSRLKISKKSFQKMMQTLILRNLDKIKVYRQKAKKDEKGMHMPDGLKIYAVSIKSENLL